MPKIRVICVGLGAAVAVALALGGAQAQTAPVGQPLALLAGLRPPHESKVHEGKARGRAKATHRTSEKAAAKRPRTAKKVAARHSRHVALKKHEHRERTFAAAATITDSAPQSASTAPSAPSANDRPAMEMAAPAAIAAAPPPTAVAVSPAPPTTADGDSPNASAMVNGQAAQDAHNPANSSDLAAPPEATPRAQATIAEAASQTVLAAPVHRDTSPVGSASWIAQVLAAFGGAVAAGAVAWFLIGGGPVRTYG
jgi:hypothetical protein